AERSFPSGGEPRAIWLQRADIFASRGDSAEAARLRSHAATVPLRTARDRLMAAQTAENPDEIVHLLDEVERLNPGDANIWCLLGLAYRNVRQDERAVTCFSMSLILNSDQPWVNALRGEVLIVIGDPKRAIHDFDVALAGPSERDVTQVNRALARE